MGTLTLYPDHIEARWYTSEHSFWPERVVDLWPFFFYSVTVDSTFTLGALFRLLDHEDVDLLEDVLAEDMSPLLEEARTPPAPDGALPRVDYLRVRNVHEDDRLRREFDGWGEWAEPYEGAWAEHPDWPREGPVGVSLTPVNAMLGLPLRYDPDLVIGTGDDVEPVRTRIDITLIDFLKAVFFELTFHGSPAERDAFLRDLRERLDEVDRGDAELIPADEVFARIRRELDRGGEAT